MINCLDEKVQNRIQYEITIFLYDAPLTASPTISNPKHFGGEKLFGVVDTSDSEERSK